METNVIYNEDCIGENGMCRLPDDSIDMILADLPYGTTLCDWDSVIDLDKLWIQYERIIKNNAAIVLTSSEPFTSALITSNLKLFKYKWKWIKNTCANFMTAKYKPLKYTEEIPVFSKGGVNTNTKNKMKYFPQGLKKINKNQNKNYHTEEKGVFKYNRLNNKNYQQEYTNYPKDYLEFDMDKKKYHPTQKPVALFEYLIKTYTNKNEVVLDNVIGSGTTAIACLKTNRKFIGFEKEEKYYNIALKRIGKFDKSYYKELPKSERPAQKQLF